MSRSISRPWIVEAVTSPGPLPTLPSAQVVGFEDTPVEDSDDTQHRVQIVGRLSDKQVWIYAIFTVDAVEHFGVRFSVMQTLCAMLSISHATGATSRLRNPTSTP